MESHVAFEALLDAAERYPAPKCHPDTRKAAQQVVIDWIFGRGDGAQKSIMWLSGAPGVGKSAILQTICEAFAGDDQPRPWLSGTFLGLGKRWPLFEASFDALARRRRSIDACFFFGRGEGAREKAFYLPATIAYQIGQSRTSCRSAVKRLLAKKPFTLGETFPSQFRRLVINPAKMLMSFQNPITIVIDALDECDSVVDQVALMDLILEACTTSRMRFLIASRPEQDIYSFFRRADVSQHTYRVQLDEESFNTSHDIETFLRLEFTRIRLSKPEACPRLSNGEDWPGSTIIRLLAAYSDSQFMFPRLAIGYIDTEYFSPNQQLQNLLTAPPPGVFSKLDALYHLILSRRPPNLRHDGDDETELRHYQDVVAGILQVIIVWPGGPFSAAQIAFVLDEKVDVVQHIIRGPLRSLFKFSEDPDSDVTFCHKSLGDCLSDPRRAGEHFIPSNGLDLLYIRILSRRPPSTLSPSQYRDLLKGVILVLATWPFQISIPEIACLLDVTPDAAQSVVFGPAQSLFTASSEGLVTFSHLSIKNFFLDVGRSEDFFIASHQPDALFIKILSRQSTSPDTGLLHTYSREAMMDVLTVIIAWPRWLTIDEIAIALEIPPTVVRSVVGGLPQSLFVPSHHCIAFNSHCGIEAFLLDANRSGEYFIPGKSRDALYMRLLYRRPPSDLSQSFSREDLMGVLKVVVAWPRRMTTDKIAFVLDLPTSIVQTIVEDGPTRLLFTTSANRPVFFSHDSIETFLLDPKRCGEFFIPTKKPDSLFVEILSRPPLSDPSVHPHPVELMMGILTAILASSLRCCLTIPEIASALDVSIELVEEIVCDSPVSSLFDVDDEDHTRLFHPRLELFLMDPTRSGEFWVNRNSKRFKFFSRLQSCSSSIRSSEVLYHS